MSTRQTKPQKAIEKSPAGICGLDEITEGGFPKGRPALYLERGYRVALSTS